jgi:nucleoside-diphosphate-sugar epimerase
MSRPSRILVTGAAGFLGRAAVAGLTRGGSNVRAAVRQPPPFSFAESVEVVVHGDLAQDVDWRLLLEGVDRVVHLAAIAHAGRGIAAERYDQINRRATARLAAAAARAGVAHFILVSSIRAQSGAAADHVLSERDAPAPTDEYGRSKLAAEGEVRAAGVPFTILRPVVLYGPGAKGNFATLLRAARSRMPLPLKDFVNRRSLLGVDNFVSTLAFVLGEPAGRGETYVVADPGPALPLADIVATLRKAQRRRPLLLPLPTDFVEIPLRLIGRADLWERFGGDLVVDPGKLIAAGWRPAHDTRAGLAALLQAAALRAASA